MASYFESIRHTLPQTKSPTPSITRDLVDQSSFGHKFPDKRLTIFQSFFRCCAIEMCTVLSEDDVGCACGFAGDFEDASCWDFGGGWARC